MQRCPLRAGAPIAVAVSGGGDSMALTLLTARWARHQGHALTALTVDHGLRLESAAEAALVAGWLSARGIAHHTVKWAGEKPATGLQDAARTARYRLLAAWAADNGIADLLLAHQQDDQAETFSCGWAAAAVFRALPRCGR
jgi:tRNA(Ile)-lysidine synthase